MKYIFNLSPVDVNAYMAETAAALEKRTELLSREKYPKMWEKTDKNNGNTKAKVPGRLISKPMSWVCLILGAIIFIPSMQDVLGRIIPLTAGAIAMVIGLRGIRGEPADRFDRSAKNLLKGRAKLPENRYSIAFDDDGMSVMDGEKEENRVPYGEFERVVETQNTFLVFFGSRVIVLPKCDIVTGTADELAPFLANKTNYIAI